jgi:hypothetical protein
MLRLAATVSASPFVLDTLRPRGKISYPGVRWGKGQGEREKVDWVSFNIFLTKQVCYFGATLKGKLTIRLFLLRGTAS